MNKQIKKKYKKALVLFGTLGLLMESICVNRVFGYDFQRPSAYQGGTVTITALAGEKSANGFIIPAGYQVDYSVTDNFLAFDPSNGCEFFVGNNLNPTGGCQFAYKPNGVIWEQGALNLGAIYDGKVVGSGQPDDTGTVKVSFRVNSLSELPQYICYTYQPTGTFLHITDEYPHTHHVWDYQTLQGRGPVNANTIDTSGPDLSVSVTAGGNTVSKNQKTWGTGATILATATDGQSRPAGIGFYQGGKAVHNGTNGANGTEYTEKYQVTANGTYQIKAYDQLGNESGVKTVTVDCIDKTAPTISSFGINQNGYCTSAVLSVQASDQGCGLHGEAYSFNNGAYTKSNQITVTENGTYTVRVRDALGNIATKNITIQNIDRTLPTIEKITRQTEDYCLQNELTVVAKDTGSGLHSQAYSYNNGPWSDQNSFVVKENGLYLIKVRDEVGNIAEQSITIQNVDKDKPILSAIIKDGGSRAVVNDISWSEKKYLAISAKDHGAGLEKIVLTSKDASYEKEYLPKDGENEEISFDTEDLPVGIYEISARDTLGNTEIYRAVIKDIDNQPPVIEEISQKQLSDKAVKITVKAHDGPGAGLHKEAYSFNGGKTWQKDNFITVSKNATYEIVVRDCLELKGQMKESVSSVKDSIPDNEGKGDKPGGGDDDGTGGKPGDGGDAGTGGKPGDGGDDGTGGKPGDGGDAGTGGKPGDGGSNGNGEKPGDGDGDGNKDRVKKSEEKETEKEKSYENFHEDDVSLLRNQTVKKEQTNLEKENLSKPKSDNPKTLYNTENNQNKKILTQKKAEKIAATLLAAICILGLAGLGLYLLLSALRNSCLFYEISDHNEKKRLARLPLKMLEDDWYVEVPDDKLGDFGTGKYGLIFGTGFVKENEGDFVVIVIDRNRIREKLREEIHIHIS